MLTRILHTTILFINDKRFFIRNLWTKKTFRWKVFNKTSIFSMYLFVEKFQNLDDEWIYAVLVIIYTHEYTFEVFICLHWQRSGDVYGSWSSWRGKFECISIKDNSRDDLRKSFYQSLYNTDRLKANYN